MKLLYIECKMGAAGDMLTAALYELLPEEEKQKFLHTMNRLFQKEKLRLVPCAGKTCGVSGTHMHVETACGAELPESSGADGHAPQPEPSDAHAHAGCTYPALLARIDALALPAPVKEDAAAVYRRIGEAEAKVHGCALTQIHFHEVGSLDAIADVVGSCLLFSMLKPDAVYASPVHVGNGTVRCAHGLLPVPAPATAELLTGIPYYCGDIMSELCTPTGAALLAHFCTKFLPMPAMTVSAVGVGLGTKELEAANCVRVFCGSLCDVGRVQNAPAFSSQEDLPAVCETADAGETDTILELSCNLDDMTGEELGYAMEALLAAGALDVFYQPVQMKKNRPGVRLSCFCQPSEQARFTKLIFLHTTTRGVRFQSYSRAKLSARFAEVQTPYGIVREKISEGFGVTKRKYEYEDLRRIAAEQNLSLSEVKRAIRPQS